MSNNQYIITNHSFSNYKSVIISHVELNFNISLDKKEIVGIADIKFNKIDSFAKSLILDTKCLIIEKVTDSEGKILDYKLGAKDTILGRALDIDISKLNENRVKIFYKTTKHSEALQWLDSKQTKGKKFPFLFTQSQAILARTWIPLQDCPAVRFTYKAKIKLDKDLLPLMSASNPLEKNSERTYTYEMKQPIPSYLMALAVGDLEFKKIGENCGVYAEPIWVDECATEFEDLPHMMEVAADLYGPYRWDRYDIVMLPPSFPFGGMENPRLTFATPTIIAGDKSLVSLVAHELAHSWSGNLVTNETWNDFWLNEGFTVYFESRIMEKVVSPEYAKMLEVLGMGDLLSTLAELKESNPDDTKLFLDLEGRNPDDGVTDIAYEKGRFFLLRVEEVVGRGAFDFFLNSYFAAKAFKTINTKEFIGTLESHLLNTKDEWKNKVDIQKWVYETGLPDSCPKPVSKYFDQVDKDVKEFLNSNLLPEVSNYTTHHWLRFLRSMPEGQSLEKLNMLDSAFSLTSAGNSEIACDWFKHAIVSKYTRAYPAMEKFLIKVGRRKFLTPLYSRMVNSDQLDLAKEIFYRAKSGYHAVSNTTITAIINEK